MLKGKKAETRIPKISVILTESLCAHWYNYDAIMYTAGT